MFILAFPSPLQYCPVVFLRSRRVAKRKSVEYYGSQSLLPDFYRATSGFCKGISTRATICRGNNRNNHCAEFQLIDCLAAQHPPRYNPDPSAPARLSIAFNCNATQNSQQSIGVRYTATSQRASCGEVNCQHRLTSAQIHCKKDSSGSEGGKATIWKEAVKCLKCPTYVFTTSAMLSYPLATLVSHMFIPTAHI